MTIESLSQLSDEELRVKVAEKMGWKLVTPKLGAFEYGFEVQNPEGRSVYSDCELPYWPQHIIPPYSTSLDAIHEAEATMNCNQAHQFVWRLREQLGTAAGIGSGVVSEWEWHATARQRAIAFLLV